jgi:two-component system nitrate/nitrite response regulator NarL
MDLMPARKDLVDFIRAGANGFIVKEATVEDFITTIRAVADGATVVPHALSGALLSHIADQANGRNTPDAKNVDRMTQREAEVSQLICEGMSNKEIAQRLDIAVYTVKAHVHNILEKLALHSRLQIAAYLHTADSPPADAQTSP